MRVPYHRWASFSRNAWAAGLEIFEERHHFDPPHRAESERYARSLRKLWERAHVAR